MFIDEAFKQPAVHSDVCVCVCVLQAVYFLWPIYVEWPALELVIVNAVKSHILTKCLSCTILWDFGGGYWCIDGRSVA